MTDWNQDSAQNGSLIHYFVNSGERCHPGIVAGNAISYGGYPASADIIQLDAVSLGVVVPLRRNNVPYGEMTDTTFPANNTIHDHGCLRPPVEI